MHPTLHDHHRVPITYINGHYEVFVGDNQIRIFTEDDLPDIIKSRQYYQIIADILGVKMTVEEIPVMNFLQENPTSSPFICHRIYDLAKLRESGFKVPATPISEGLRIHVAGLTQLRR